MHDIRWIRENRDEFDRGLERRGLAPEAERLIALDERRRQAIQKAEAAQARRNAASREVGAAKKSGEEMAAQTLMGEIAQLKADIPALEAEEKKAGKELDDALAWIPNLPLPAPEVPDGKDEKDNVEHHHFGAKREYGFAPKQHFELGEDAGADGFRDRGETLRRAVCCFEERAWRAWNARSGSSCSICIRTSTGTRKSRRRCWCAMT